MNTGVGQFVRKLGVGYFALVMATGIVSTGAHAQHWYALSVALLWIAGVAYVGLVVANAARIVMFRKDFLGELRDPRKGFATFTFVAATNVLGTRLAVDGHHAVAITALVIGWLAWLVLGYMVPWMAVLGRARRPVLQDVNGTWFIWVVGSQSVAVLAAVLQPQLDSFRSELALLAVFCWSVGVFLYGAAGLLVAVRMLLYPMGPEDLTPPYWIAMGATAITVFAGARIVDMAEAPATTATRHFISAAAVLFWAFGTWLIPALIAAGIWRHVVRRVRLTYEPSLWSMVFPLGMYGVAGHYLGRSDQLPTVATIGDLEIWLSLAAWALVFGALLYRLGTGSGSRLHPAEPQVTQ